jgi:signal peptidase I
MRIGQQIGVGLVVAVTVGVAVSMVAIGSWKMPSGSMLPTLPVGSRILVSRFRTTPSRGEVIVFKFPERPEQDFVKRVIAVGGDKLEVRNGHPILDGWEVPSCKVGTYSYQEDFVAGSAGFHKGELFVEFLDAAAYLVFFDSSGAGAEYQGPFEAKAGEYWVMGDNRNNSHDSRMWFGGQGGGVPQENVRGTVMVDTTKPTPPASMPSLAGGVAKCMSERPSRDKTKPPK